MLLRACVQSGGHLWLVSLWAPWLWAPWLVPRSAPCEWALWWALRVGRWCATESGALACTSLCFEGATCERAARCMLSCTRAVVRAVVQSGRHLLLAPSWVASWALRARTVTVSVRRPWRQPRVSRRPMTVDRRPGRCQEHVAAQRPHGPCARAVVLPCVRAAVHAVVLSCVSDIVHACVRRCVLD